MRIFVNGEHVTTDAETIGDLLTELDREAAPCAVECNGQLLPWRSRGTTPLQEGDRIEIVTLVGGG